MLKIWVTVKGQGKTWPLTDEAGRTVVVSKRVADEMVRDAGLERRGNVFHNGEFSVKFVGAH